MKKKKKKSINILDKERKSRRHPWLRIRELDMLASGGYFDSEGVLHNAEGSPRCTSVVRSTGKVCKNFSVPGEMCCHIHGGFLARTKSNKLRVYSEFLQEGTMSKVYEDIVGNDEIQGLKEELGLLRSLLASLVEETGTFEAKELKDVAKVISEIRQLVEGCTKAEIKLGQLIDIGKVTVIVAALAKIISRYVKDPEILERISNEFDNVIWPAPLASTPQPEQEAPIGRVCALPGQVPERGNRP